MNENVIRFPESVTLPSEPQGSVELFVYNGESVQLFSDGRGGWLAGCQSLGYLDVEPPRSHEELHQILLRFMAKIVLYRGPFFCS